MVLGVRTGTRRPHGAWEVVGRLRNVDAAIAVKAYARGAIAEHCSEVEELSQGFRLFVEARGRSS
jgi:hypothetical protein